MDQTVYQAYCDILWEELQMALGCTEPISVAYAGALARRALEALPERVELTVSGNIIKNVKSVIVPHTGGRKGLAAAVCAGILYGDAGAELEVLAAATEQDIAGLDEYLARTELTIRRSNANCPFDIRVLACAQGHEAFVQIIGSHTNVVMIRKDDNIRLKKEFQDETVPIPENRKYLNVKDIVEFADTVDLNDVADVLKCQCDCNMAISEAGLHGHYGAEIGKILLKSYGNSVQNRAKAWAAAGSDARMVGCELPVVINSGSGNQGLTASIPVIIYARECAVSESMMYRALVISNLITIHLKTEIGSLSAYCGATSAGVGAGAGICYLYGGREQEISHTIVNALAINSGMICDGAKPSCAAKIASAVEAGLLGMQMYIHDSEFMGGDGIVLKGVENTIRAVSQIARDGMRSTDREILDLMLQDN